MKTYSNLKHCYKYWEINLLRVPTSQSSVPQKIQASWIARRHSQRRAHPPLGEN